MSVRSATAIAITLLLLPLEAAALELQLDPVSVEGKFEFTRKNTELTDVPPAFNERLSGFSPSYEVWMNPDGVTEVSQYDYFRYELYVRPRANPAQVTRVVFQGRATGQFDDQVANVHFRIADGGVNEEGTMNLPVFGSVAPDAVISSHQPDDPYEVDLSAPREIIIPVTNELKKMVVSITGASASSNDSALWKQPIDVRGGSRPFVPPFLLAKGTTDKTYLRINLVPRTAHAFATALVRGRGRDDDVITVLLTYKTLARDEKQVAIPVHVQFVPWPPYLLVVAFAASIVGWLVLLLVRARKEQRDERYLILGAGAVAAVLAEIVGMLFVAGKSELKLFSVTVDPFQVTGAAFIGFLAGLAGYKSRELLRSIGDMQIFKFMTSSRPDA